MYKLSNMLPNSVRRWLWRISDGEYRRARNESRKRTGIARGMKNEAGAAIIRSDGTSVLEGPFKGMKYLDHVRKNIPTEKLLGTYEKELWGVVHEIVNSSYESVVILGAAEGYYAVGLAYRMPKVEVVAFEAQSDIRLRLTQLARENQLANRIVCKGKCDAAKLESQLARGGRALVVCDIEGAESVVLDPAAAPSLLSTDLLVEVHDHIVSDVTALIVARFRSTHDVMTVSSVSRLVQDFTSSAEISSDLMLAAMDEWRSPHNKWLWMRAR